MRYPIGIHTFETIITGNYVYVDKTDLVYELSQEHVCLLSRPRKFGKSLLISTLAAYFSGRKDLFSGLHMENLEKNWDVYPVFHIDFADGNFNSQDELVKKLESCLSEWESIYGYTDYHKTLGCRFQYVLEQAYKKTGKKAVVLIDEYDKPLLDALGEESEKTNQGILGAFYGTFKSADASLRFVLLTGVTRFSQSTVFSGFNQADDISMDRQYDSICGITEKELYHYFADPIRSMADVYHCSEADMKMMLKKQYGGYHFSEALLDIYNPFSLINAFKKMRIDSYWYRSETPTYLTKILNAFNVNMQKLLEHPYEATYFADYHADVENPLAILYQSGYLTIKDYDHRDWVYTLDYPNIEVKKGFISLIANEYFQKKGRFNF